jgi:hypothetical protein
MDGRQTVLHNWQLSRATCWKQWKAVTWEPTDQSVLLKGEQLKVLAEEKFAFVDRLHADE